MHVSMIAGTDVLIVNGLAFLWFFGRKQVQADVTSFGHGARKRFQWRDFANAGRWLGKAACLPDEFSRDLLRGALAALTQENVATRLSISR
jgi:uncharacterized iron-regulated membrane protein